MESNNTDHSDTPEIIIFQMKWIPGIPHHLWPKKSPGMSALSRRSAWRETLALFEAMREHSVQVQKFSSQWVASMGQKDRANTQREVNETKIDID